MYRVILNIKIFIKEIIRIKLLIIPELAVPGRLAFNNDVILDLDEGIILVKLLVIFDCFGGKAAHWIFVEQSTESLLLLEDCLT